MNIIKQPKNTILVNKFIKENNFKVGAELGVRRGEFTTFLCQDNSDIKMIAVDIWAEHKQLNETHPHESNFSTCMNNFKPYNNRITVIRKLTTEAARDVPDNSIDFIFIDATHTAAAVSQDILAWLPKLKENSIISGHDYHSHWDNGKLKAYIDTTFPKKIVDEWTCWYSFKKDINL